MMFFSHQKKKENFRVHKNLLNFARSRKNSKVDTFKVVS